MSNEKKWSTGGHATVIASDLLETQGAMRVSLIQTERAAFVYCRASDKIDKARAIRREHGFDHIPVLEDESDEVCGVLVCLELDESNDTVGERMRPLTSALVVSDRASIISFIQGAEQEPFRIVVGSEGVTGLVSISDLQRLPVRAALFTYITAIELLLGQEIERLFPTPADWLAKLEPERMRAVEKLYDKSVKEGRDVGHAACTQLSDKFDVLASCDRWMSGVGWSKVRWKKLKSRTVKLRDSVAHAAPFAVDHASAMTVCCLVESLGELVENLEMTTRNRVHLSGPSAHATVSEASGPS